MKFYGNADLNNNFAEQLRFSAETSFPTDTSRMVGRIIFKDKRLYICTEIAAGLPVWVPLTKEMDTYVHDQTTSSVLWTLNHNLGTSNPLVQVWYDGKLIIPDEVTIVDGNTCTISFAAPIAGRAVVMFGDPFGATKTVYSYTYYQTNPASTWTVNHNLGYNPVVRVFVGNNEVQPDSITFPTVNQVVITFSSVYTGVARFI